MSEPFLGTVIIFAGNFAPKGWAFCNGQIMPIAQNQALFSILGTTFGGNGTTNFALPNLQGRVPISPGQGISNYALGQVGGTESNTMNINQMPMHSHTVAPYANSSDGGNSTPAGGFMGKTSGDAIYAPNHDNSPMGITPTSVAGGSQPFPIMQPYLAIYYIIALEGLYPSRN